MAGGEGPLAETKLPPVEVRPVHEIPKATSVTSESEFHSCDQGDEALRFWLRMKKLFVTIGEKSLPPLLVLLLVYDLLVISFLSTARHIEKQHQQFGGEVTRRQIARHIDNQTSRYQEIEWRQESLKNSTLAQIEDINALIRGLTDAVRALEGLLTRAEGKETTRLRQFLSEDRSYIVKNRVTGNVLGVSCDLTAFAKTYHEGTDEAIQWRFIPNKLKHYMKATSMWYLLQNVETRLILDIPVDPSETLNWNQDKHELIWNVESKGDKIFRILNAERHIYLCEGSGMTLETSKECLEGRDEWVLHFPE